MSDAPSSPDKRSPATGYATAILIFLIITLFFLLPGFVTGWQSKLTGRRMSPLSDRPDMHGSFINVYCYPARTLCGLVPALWSFYDWEFRTAGGKRLIFVY